MGKRQEDDRRQQRCRLLLRSLSMNVRRWQIAQVSKRSTLVELFNETGILLGINSPYVAVFVLLTIGIWLVPFAEELALLTAGYLISAGTVQWWPMVLVTCIGVFLGDAVLF